ncbi:MAG: hypothetical protein HYV27_07780 [Candidatus Hydrogenedentes bacterium]|nr:hypothetical protein [Candidatus Hydrogenedentota bacterium]
MQSGAPPLPPRAIAHAVALWGVFSLVAVALRGVRWDENYEFAQVIAGAVPYPPDHPLPQYVFSMFSLQTQGLAWLMRLTESPLLLNGLRNVLFLFMTVFPVHLFAVACTRETRWGIVAAALVLLGIHVQFFSTYPVQVWPELYSNGQVGLGCALLIAALYAGGWRRAACLIAGLLPALHLGQFPPVALFLAATSLLDGEAPFSRERWRLALCGAAGLTVSGAVWLLVWRQSLPLPVSGPYFSTQDPGEILHGYMQHWASHRALTFDTAHLSMGAAALLAACILARRPTRQDALWHGAIYIATLCAIVWPIMFIHYALGVDTPAILVRWMPYRLMNHATVVLIPLCVVVLAGAGTHKRATLLLIAVLAGGILRPLAAYFLPGELFARYLGGGEGFLFLILGGAAASALGEFPALRARSFWMGAWLCGLALTAWFHQFGGACAAAGCIFVLAVWRRPAFENGWPWAAVLGATSCILLLVQEARHREQLPLSSFEADVRALLAQRGDDRALILVRHQQEGLQARLYHPVMTDMATITWVPYKPAIAPSLQKLYTEVYGIDLMNGPSSPGFDQPWHTVWPGRTRAEWVRLAKAYEFRYVMAPAFMALDLPRVLEGASDHLYEVPLLVEPV